LQQDLRIPFEMLGKKRCRLAHLLAQSLCGKVPQKGGDCYSRVVREVTAVFIRFAFARQPEGGGRAIGQPAGLLRSTRLRG